MTHSSQSFSTYSPCPSNKKIAIVVGSLATIVSQGEVHLNKSIVLKNVLHVPKVPLSFLSKILSTIKDKIGFIIIVLGIHHLTFLKLCFLYCSKELM